ncbi:MAG: PstS family phosphate ABC transporter substrate-binding protein [Bacteroidota bacterium]|nr:PstS family phosphate ABC transporter substrate-binding protein [Bacteroidota bacterium]
MNKQIISLLLISSIGLNGCGSDSTKKEDNSSTVKTSITLKGSDTVLPLGQKEAEEYMKKDSAASITVVGGGTGVGVAALLEGTTDIAMASRDLKTEEKLKFSEKKIEISETIIAYDALMVVVHPENKINQLTREQLEDIFTGKIGNWKDVGGADEKIIAYSRESSSGTYEFFKEHVLEKKNYATNVLSMPATGSIVQSISQTKGAIGYIGLAYDTKEVKALSVSYDQGKTYVAPSVEAAKNKSYPISRPLFYMFTKESAGKVKSFVDYALSDEGQKIVQEIGYVPVK